MLRDELLANCKQLPKPQPVETPEWPAYNGQIFVRKLTAADLDRFYAVDSDESERARFVCLVACNADGDRIFKDSDAADVAKFEFETINRISIEGQRFNGMLGDQRETTAKN